MSTQTFSRTDIERRRYGEKIGNLQYKRYFSDAPSPNISQPLVVENNSFIDVQNQIKLINDQITEVKDMLSSIIAKFDSYDSSYRTEISAGNELVVYDGSSAGTVLREKKNIFGKTKWVEEKV